MSTKFALNCSGSPRVCASPGLEYEPVTVMTATATNALRLDRYVFMETLLGE
jgi:hypothetical protein